MARLGAIAIIVSAFVVGLGNGHVEHAFGTLYLRRDFGQIRYLQRRSVLFDNLHKGNIVEIEFTVLRAEFILGKIEGLIDQIIIFIFHPSELV